MDLVLQALVGLMCLIVTGLGATSMFAPKSMVDVLSVEPAGSAGLNTIRGVVGGMFIGCSALLVTGLVTGHTAFFLAVATIMGVVAIGRLVGIAVDGFHKSVVIPLVVEAVGVTIFVGAHFQLGPG